MLVVVVIVAILVVLVVVGRHKWKNAAAKEEEILRLVAEEEAVIAKLQQLEEQDYNNNNNIIIMPPPPPPPPQTILSYCAVCYSPTTTRCSRCKAVRYCSGKCQIIHWRQGHKDDCQQVVTLQASREREFGFEKALEDPFDMHLNDGAKLFPDPTQELHESGSSCSSLPSFSSSTEQSESSFDASTSEVLELGTPIRLDRAPTIGVNSCGSQTIYDSDDADGPSLNSLNCTVYSTNTKLGASKMKRAPASKTDEPFESTSFRDKRNTEAAAVEDFVPSKTVLRTYQSSSSIRSSAAENRKNQSPASTSRAIRSTSVRGSGNHPVSNEELKSSRCSMSLKMLHSDEYRKDEGQLCNGKETKSSYRSLSNYQNFSTKPESLHIFPSELEPVRVFSQSASKGLKTSVRKFVHHFRTPKQSKSGTFDMEDSGENYNHKVIFPLKLFMQLYSSDHLELQPFGLVNCGNSCYANAVLQCLTFTRPVTSYLLQGFHSKTCHKRDWCFVCEFECLIRKGQEMNFPLSPVKIMSQIPAIGSHLSHGREEDAHEFLRNVVDTMQSICLEEAGVCGPLAEDSTLVGLTFGGYLRSKIKCTKCSGRSVQCDRMMDLTVEIAGNIFTLEEALKQFTTSETLGGDDKYKCSRCKSYEKAKKKLTVLEAPNILTVVLKRFLSGSMEKLNKLVQFPEVLNLAPYMSGTVDGYPTYHLYAVVVHLGMTNAAYSGHYVSYVKDFRGDWYRIDDSRVSPVDLETVLSVEAYILFYARRTPRAGSLNFRNGSGYSDGKTKRNMEAISSSNSAKKNNSMPKMSSSCRNTESTMLHQRSEKQRYWISPNDFNGNHLVDADGWGSHLKHRNHILDSPSDSSSIFSASDAGSYSTDSTKDSSAEEISGYLFGSNWYQP